MTDYINRQAAIGVLEERLQANGYSNVALVSELNRSIGYLMRLPSAEPKTCGWIPCSERLPENDGGMYLVTDYCEQINRRRIHISYCYVNREGFWSDVPIDYKVIAWMPLPTPYKGGDTE